jgi:hypothetical protein
LNASTGSPARPWPAGCAPRRSRCRNEIVRLIYEVRDQLLSSLPRALLVRLWLLLYSPLWVLRSSTFLKRAVSNRVRTPRTAPVPEYAVQGHTRRWKVGCDS